MYTESTSCPPTPLSLALASLRRRVAPLYPLHQWVAVNPYLGYSELPFASAASLLGARLGLALFPSRSHYREAWSQGEIALGDLELALAKHGRPPAETLRAVDFLAGNDPALPTCPTVAHFLSGEHQDWVRWTTDYLSRFCSAFLDHVQTPWGGPWTQQSLFAAWREYATVDRSSAWVGLSELPACLTELSDDPIEAIGVIVQEILPPNLDLETFLFAQLRNRLGWTGHLRYLDREEEMRGRAGQDRVVALIAMALTVEWALFRQFIKDSPELSRWRGVAAAPLDYENNEGLALWQSAYEINGIRRSPLRLLNTQGALDRPRPLVHVAFCIDVRSERFRRNLEAAFPDVETLGVAGFFGAPHSVVGTGTDQRQNRGPALFAPAVELKAARSEETNTLTSPSAQRAWAAFQHASASCFTYVESFGWQAVAGLLPGKKRPVPQCHSQTPGISSLPLTVRVNLALGLLRSFPADTNWAPLVVLCGHGSEVVNNPQAAGLQCGACGGHAGDQNARLAARVLNDPAVRGALLAEGVEVPEDSVFVAALHDTATDGVTCFVEGSLSPAHARTLDQLKSFLAAAQRTTQRERAKYLGDEVPVETRGDDPAETRPELGLAGNMALCFGPRQATRGLNLEGRVFLHEYSESQDTDGRQLATLLSGPGVVAAWINLQYYGSCVAPEQLGAGDKVLHNVCAGVGVLEGGYGDLRSGLATQSVRFGDVSLHEPRRLTWWLVASRARVERALELAPQAAELANHHWVQVVAAEKGRTYLRSGAGRWLELT